MRSWTAGVAPHLAVGLVAAAVGFAVGRTVDGTPTRAASSAAPSAASSADPGPSPLSPEPLADPPPASAAPPPPGTSADPLALARSGHLPALKAIEARDPRARTIDEALALEAGHAALARAEARRLVDDVAADPSLLDDAGTAAHALRLALDPAVAPELLAGLAPIDHASVPDLLFELASRGEPGARLVLLAEDLLNGAARTRASPALDATLRARAARSCAALAALLPSIAERADDRVLPVLDRVDVRTGCGPGRTDDCFGCLRDGAAKVDLDAARAAARERRFEPSWRRARRQRGSAQQRKPVE